MIQRKLIAVIGVVALLACSAGTGEASLSRVEGMGLTPVPFLSQFTDDYVNIFHYPTSVVRQNNLVIGELGNNPDGDVNEVSFDDQSFTIIKNFTNFGAIAFQMKQTALNSLTPGLEDALTHEQLDIIWGRGFDNFDLAVRLDITNSSFEFDDNVAPTSIEARGSGFDPGDPYPFGTTFAEDAIRLGLDVRGPVEINSWGITPAIALHLANDNRVEGAITFRQYSLERTRTDAGVAGERWEDEGNLSYAVFARAFLNQGDRGTWIPAAWYVNDDLSYSVANVVGLVETREIDETYRNYGVGLSYNMRVNDNNLLIFGAAAAQTKHDFERNDTNDGAADASLRDLEDKSTTAPLFFSALETDATSWLKVRIGASRALMNTREERTLFNTDASTEKERFSDFNFSLGTGIRWNNLDIDMTLNEAFPLSGGWILSGDSETPFTRVSATYHY